MPVEFVSNPSGDPTGAGRRFDDAPDREPGLFWWIIAIIILTGLAVFSWVFSIYVFSYPEKPFNYRLLTKLEKIEPIREFPRLNVPGGKERTAKQIYATFYDYDATLTEVNNDLLKRSFLWNYTEEPPIYITGKFEVTESRLLTADDVFTSGVVIRAKSEDYPNAFLEFIFPTEEGKEPAEHFRPGDILILEKNRSYAAVLHIDWLNEDDMIISATSVVYGRHRIDDTRFINQSAPKTLNMDGSWPIAGLEEIGSETEPETKDPTTDPADPDETAEPDA